MLSYIVSEDSLLIELDGWFVTFCSATMHSRKAVTLGGYGCDVAQGQSWLNQGTLDAIVIQFGIIWVINY